jgi:hypothetical protein
MKCLMVLFSTLIFVTSCGSGKTTLDVNPAELSGKAEGYTGGAGELVFDSGDGLRGTINADGTFNLLLPSPSTDELSLSTDESEYSCDDISFSSSLVKGGGLFYIGVLQEGEFKGVLAQGTSLAAVENALSSKPVAGQGILRIYASEDSNVKGQNCINEPQYSADVGNVNFDINLKKGWNLLTMDLATDKTFSFFNTTSLEGINWYFVQEMNF